MKIFTESEAVGSKGPSISCGDLIRLNDGREVIKTRHSTDDHYSACKRNSGERCTFINNDFLCGRASCTNAIYLEKLVYLQLKLIGEVE